MSVVLQGSGWWVEAVETNDITHTSAEEAVTSDAILVSKLGSTILGVTVTTKNVSTVDLGGNMGSAVIERNASEPVFPRRWDGTWRINSHKGSSTAGGTVQYSILLFFRKSSNA